VHGLGTPLLDCVDHRLRVRWSSHHFGQFIDPIVEVRAIAAKLLKQCDHLGDLLLGQNRQLQIEQFVALGKAILSYLREGSV
jgi:hypothetical protein